MSVVFGGWFDNVNSHFGRTFEWLWIRAAGLIDR